MGEGPADAVLAQSVIPTSGESYENLEEARRLSPIDPPLAVWQAQISTNLARQHHKDGLYDKTRDAFDQALAAFEAASLLVPVDDGEPADMPAQIATHFEEVAQAEACLARALEREPRLVFEVMDDANKQDGPFRALRERGTSSAWCVSPARKRPMRPLPKTPMRSTGRSRYEKPRVSLTSDVG